MARVDFATIEKLLTLRCEACGSLQMVRSDQKLDQHKPANVKVGQAYRSSILGGNT